MNLRNLSWQQVVLFGLLLAAPILASVFANPTLGTVSAAVATIVAWFTNSGGPKPPDSPTGAPDLKLIAGGVATLFAVFTLGACEEFFPTVQDGTDVVVHVNDLDKCETAAVNAKKACETEDAGLSCGERGWSVWELCKADGGLK